MVRVLLFVSLVLSTSAHAAGLMSLSKVGKPCRTFIGRDLIVQDPEDTMRVERAYVVEDYSSGMQFGLNMDVLSKYGDVWREYRLLIIGEKVSEDATIKTYVSEFRDTKITFRVEESGQDLIIELESDRYGVRTISNYVCAKDQL